MNLILKLNKKISKSKKGGKFSNMSFVFTGFRDKSLEELIQSEGGDKNL